jgi:ribosomal protein S27E
MSVNGSTPEASSVETTATPTLRTSASYLGCRHCEEGSLVYDPEIEASRCRSCGKRD